MIAVRYLEDHVAGREAAEEILEMVDLLDDQAAQCLARTRVLEGDPQRCVHSGLPFIGAGSIARASDLGMMPQTLNGCQFKDYGREKSCISRPPRRPGSSATRSGQRDDVSPCGDVGC